MGRTSTIHSFQRYLFKLYLNLFKCLFKASFFSFLSVFSITCIGLRFFVSSADWLPMSLLNVPVLLRPSGRLAMETAYCITITTQLLHRFSDRELQHFCYCLLNRVSWKSQSHWQKVFTHRQCMSESLWWTEQNCVNLRYSVFWNPVVSNRDSSAD